MWFSKPDLQQEALDNAPYIFPYFFDLKKIKLEWRGIKLTPATVEDPKLKMWSYCYFKTNVEILGIINFWTYFKQFTNDLFCCFRRDDQDTSIMRFFLFSTKHLHPLENLEASAKEMKEKSLPWVFQGNYSEIALSMKMDVGVNDFVFPEDYKEIDELSLFATKDGLYPDQSATVYWADYVLIILRPKKNEVEVIPQDWFNKSDGDFDYVWPTRIARSRKDNRFYGQGIRMANFILDPTGRQRVG
jgi:hypothetical protein